MLYRITIQLHPTQRTLIPYTTLFRSEGGDWAVITAGWAFAVMAGAFTAIACGSGDAHLNPALTLGMRSEEHKSELQSLRHLVCRLLLEKKKQSNISRFNIKLSNSYVL